MNDTIAQYFTKSHKIGQEKPENLTNFNFSGRWLCYNGLIPKAMASANQPPSLPKDTQERLLAESRRLQIVALLSRAGQGVVSVRELSRLLGVSEMTIRRDLDFLQESQVVKRVHGGAVAYQAEAEKPFALRLSEFDPQKKSIGWAAAQLVEEGDRIILDAGTTTQQVAIHLGCKKNLTVITNNIAAAIELARCPQIDTILLGGTLKHQELCTVGPMVKQGLAALSADKLFLSAAGLTIQHGATDPDLREVEVKQAMIAAAREVILVVDSSKWGQSKLARIVPLDQVHIVVSDDALPAQAIHQIESLGRESRAIQVITPERS